MLKILTETPDREFMKLMIYSDEIGVLGFMKTAKNEKGEDVKTFKPVSYPMNFTGNRSATKLAESFSKRTGSAFHVAYYDMRKPFPITYIEYRKNECEYVADKSRNPKVMAENYRKYLEEEAKGKGV